MRQDTTIILQKKIQVLYNVISLEGQWGKKRLVTKIDPYIGLEHVAFRIDHINIGTKSSDDIEEIDLIVYEGYPNDEDLSPKKICISGLLEVGNDGLYIDMGSHDHEIIPWATGITSVLVILDLAEVEKREVRSVTLYLKSMGKAMKRSGIRKILGL